MHNNKKCFKVLFITPWYPTKERPGTGIFIREYAKAVQLYDDIAVLHYAGADSAMRGNWRIEQELDESLTNNIPTYRVWWPRYSTIPKTSFLIRNWSKLQAFRKIRTKFIPDIIHANISEIGLVPALIGKLYRIPVVISEHYVGFVTKILSKRHLLTARLVFRLTDLVMPVSVLLQKGIEEYGIKTNFRIVPNALDTSLFKPGRSISGGNKIKRLLFVGALAEHKGITYLLHALQQLLQHYSHWHLDIVGGGRTDAQRGKYEKLTSALGITDKVTFYGFQPREKVVEFMHRSDIFIGPSFYETFGCAILEAMACGLPIVSTSVGGLSEMIDEKIGILVPPKDVESLSKAIGTIIDRYDTFDRDYIARKAQRYSLESIGALLHSIYKDCIQAGN